MPLGDVTTAVARWPQRTFFRMIGGSERCRGHPGSDRGERVSRSARTHALWVALLAVAIGDCARASDAARIDLSRTGAALIEVRNDQFDDCVIYLIRGGTPIPLGIAPGLSRRTFRVDPGTVG
jgi:hypothetical protein